MGKVGVFNECSVNAMGTHNLQILGVTVITNPYFLGLKTCVFGVQRCWEGPISKEILEVTNENSLIPQMGRRELESLPMYGKLVST